MAINTWKKKTRKNRNGVCDGGGEENPWNWLQRATKRMTEIETEKYLQRDLSNSHAQIHKWKENRSAKMEYVHECEWLVTRSQVRKREMNLLCIFGSCKPSFLYVAFEHRESSKLHREMKTKNCNFTKKINWNEMHWIERRERQSIWAV